MKLLEKIRNRTLKLPAPRMVYSSISVYSRDEIENYIKEKLQVNNFSFIENGESLFFSPEDLYMLGLKNQRETLFSVDKEIAFDLITKSTKKNNPKKLQEVLLVTLPNNEEGLLLASY